VGRLVAHGLGGGDNPARQGPEGVIVDERVSSPTSEQTAPLPQVVRELWELVVAYFKQETVIPLKQLGRYIAFGLLGADRWRNPEHDLPADFEARRGHYYAELSKPLDATKFIGPLRQEMTDELLALQEALPRLDWLKISDRRGGRITLAPPDADSEPRNQALPPRHRAARAHP